MFEGQVESAKRFNLLYDDVERHYHVITDLMSAMAKLYFCQACNKSWGETCRTYATRRVVTAWWARLAHLKIFAFPAKYATGTLEVRNVSIITRDVHRRKEPYVREIVVVARVEHLWRAKTTNVINDFARTVSRTKKPVTCVSWDRWRTCCQPAIGCCTYFTISRPLRTRDIRKRPRYTFQILFVYSSIVRSARMWKMFGVIACNAAWENTRSGTFL